MAKHSSPSKTNKPAPTVGARIVEGLEQALAWSTARVILVRAPGIGSTTPK